MGSQIDLGLKNGKKVNFFKNLGRVVIFERFSTVLLAEAGARQRGIRRARNGMPECEFAQLTGNSNSIMHLVIGVS